MVNEQIIGGGKLVRLADGSLAVEGAPGARRGLVVASSTYHADGAEHRRGTYRLTQRAVAGTDMWRVRVVGSEVVS